MKKTEVALKGEESSTYSRQLLSEKRQLPLHE